MLDMPFEKFERRRYLKYDRDLAFLRFEPSLWRTTENGRLAETPRYLRGEHQEVL